ncbi:MAG: HAMP domain-containing protein [Azoarcus sp.]|jgi:protein-histidine pros-kinase|nr:HAMP domain-containing protein [Azoarcus sp.]
MHSLFSRLMLIWLIGIFLILIASLALFMSERNRVGQKVLFEGIAQEIASNAELLDQIPPGERRRLLDDRGHRRMRLSLRALPDHLQPLSEHPLLTALREIMPERQFALYFHPADDRAAYWPLLLVVKLADGSPLSARLPAWAPPPIFQGSYHRPFLIAVLALFAGIFLITWLCVRIATRPLSHLAAAAHALGENPEAPPLTLSGPTEVVQAAAAFNQMQERLNTHIRERTRILASISHDLQTPITRLRLRAEMIDDETLKRQFESDLGAMQNLIREGLDYAHSMENHALAPIDLYALLAALAGEASDLGWTVGMTGGASAPFIGQPGALKRALWNLIENGVKFGQTVDLRLEESADAFLITLRDHGPGLPQEEMERVFAPFYRTESSRNRATGGTGLGLAIARNLLHVQHGDVSLANHPEGGLVATVVLPRRRTDDGEK